MNNVLKYFYYAGICCLLISCKKSESNLTTITVVEFGTNKPVAHAQIDLYQGENCTWGLCTYLKVGEVGVDENGNAHIPENIGKIGIRANGYFEIKYFFLKGQVIALDLIGQVKIHCRKTNSYPAGSTFGVNIQGENISDRYPIREYVYKSDHADFYFPVNGDSTIITKAFGEQVNSITWFVLDSSGTSIMFGGPLQIAVPRTGIAELEINY